MPLNHLPGSFILTGVSAILLAGCSRTEADPRTGPQLVRVGTAGTSAEGVRHFTGIVSARVQSDLGFRVPGKVIARLVDTGQSVRRGQPLMRVDRTDLALATTAQAGAVAAARARAIQTIADERRYRNLVSAGAVSASSYDQAKAAADAARAQLSAAQAQANVTGNEASYSVLYADADGVVVETLAEPGQVVTAGQTVIRLAHAGPREAIVSLPETVRPVVGSVAQATLFDSGRTASAKLRQLSESADPQTRTFEARYVLGETSAAAPLGSTVTITIPDRSNVSTLRVPLAALYDVGRGPGIWLVRGNPAKVTWRPVRLAAVDDETATVAAGLHPGDRFVSLGAHLLHEGENVRLSAPIAGAVR